MQERGWYLVIHLIKDGWGLKQLYLISLPDLIQ